MGGFQQAMLAYQRPLRRRMVNLVGNAFRQWAGHPHTAQVRQPDTPMAVVMDAGHSRCCQERTGAGAVLLVEYRLAGFQAFAHPAGACVAVVPARALGYELTDLGYEGQRDGLTCLAALNSFSSSWGVSQRPASRPDWSLATMRLYTMRL